MQIVLPSPHEKQPSPDSVTLAEEPSPEFPFLPIQRSTLNKDHEVVAKLHFPCKSFKR